MSPTEIALRERLLLAAIGLIRRGGLAGLTQPRLAKAAGISQSHLTYYFPTRRDLLTAVLDRTATDQLAGVEHAMRGAASSPTKLAKAMGAAFEKAENSRVLISFALAASEDPEARAIFERLTRGIRGEVATAANRIGIDDDAKTVALVHALGVGLSVLNLALGGSSLRPKAAEGMAMLFRLLSRTRTKD
ncbi:MAG: TetR/AcrR family transcriptional regulator [Rhodospirillales bacterium]|nr:TetR/AcrR family transcriptional regulator [Rhodospirillales bacterium]